jgi:hypothetical protein
MRVALPFFEMARRACTYSPLHMRISTQSSGAAACQQVRVAPSGSGKKRRTMNSNQGILLTSYLLYMHGLVGCSTDVDTSELEDVGTQMQAYTTGSGGSAGSGSSSGSANGSGSSSGSANGSGSAGGSGSSSGSTGGNNWCSETIYRLGSRAFATLDGCERAKRLMNDSSSCTAETRWFRGAHCGDVGGPRNSGSDSTSTGSNNY